MTDPTIATALDAASEAGRQAMALPGCCLEGTGCELPPCHCSRVAAAAAVAAFLRALPEHQMKLRLGPAAFSPEATSTRKMAAAVEAAAKGEA